MNICCHSWVINLTPRFFHPAYQIVFSETNTCPDCKQQYTIWFTYLGNPYSGFFKHVPITIEENLAERAQTPA